MTRARTIALAAMLLAATALGAVIVKKRHASAIEAVHPQRGAAVHAVYATGTVEPTVMFPVAPRVTARLMQLSADEGQQVAKGDVLAQLEDSDVQSGIAELKAREVLAAQELKRTERLAASNSVSRAEADQARANFESAKAALTRAKEEAGFLRLVAPEDATVIRRDGEVGQLLQAGEPVFWLSCCAGLRITTEVDEEDIPFVQPGQHVVIRADAFEGQVFRGRVSSITPKGDPVARSYRVRVIFDESTPLQIGMTAETNIIIRETPDALLVPTTALRGDTVWLDEGGTLKRRKVKAGARGPEKTEILDGLDESSLVLAVAAEGMKEGDAVRTRLVGQPAAAKP